MRKKLAGILPKHDEIKCYRGLSAIAHRLHDANLWHINRRSISRAVPIGVFLSFMPLPGQMLLAAWAAMYFRANLPLSVVLVWISNPLTMGPIYYFCYRLGAWILNTPTYSGEITWSLSWLINCIGKIGGPLFLGCFIIGILSALIGYLITTLAWRHHVAKRYRKRQRNRQSL